jgi:hypothetical protein
MAAGQGTIDRKGGGGNSQPGISQGESGQDQPKPKGAEQPKGRQTQGQGQNQPGQVQIPQTRPSTTGQAPRGEENRALDQNPLDRDQNRAQGQNQRERDQGRTQGQNQRERDENRTQGQIQIQRDQDQNRTQGQNQRERDQERNQGQIQRDQRQQEGQQEGGGSKNSVTLTTEQRTKIRNTVFRERNVPRVSKLDFSINVGTVVPRTVRVVEVPELMIEIYPEWRGYRYFVYNDEIIIVDPDTLTIVAVVAV